MNPFEMVVLIVAITAVASVLRAKYGVIRRGKGEEFRNPNADAENQRLREELRAIKERVATLERIATDDSTALDREIERLRDR
jgi:uncharacterized protein YlxW (UPF0749 family)